MAHWPASLASQAGCAYVVPINAVVIGALSGIVLVISIGVVESMKIDDAVGAFSVHGACGAFGTLMIGIVGSSALGAPSLFDGGTLNTLGTQILGVVVVAVWVGVTSFLMFGALKAADLLHVAPEADRIGIDAYEHHASVWPNVLPLRETEDDE